MQIPQHQSVHAFFREHQRHLIDRRHILRRDHRLIFHIAEERDLALDVPRQKPVRAAQQNIRLDTHTQQLLHRVLRRLRLQLLRRPDPRNQRHVHEYRVLAPQLLPHLPDRLDERQGLDISHRAADLHDHHIHIGRQLFHRRLDLIRHMRDHLHRLAQIIAAPLLGDDLFVDPAGGQVVIARELRMREALIVPKIEVRLRAVIGHEHLSVLKRRHRPRIHVQIRIELLQVDLQPPRLQQAPDRRGSKPLT